MEKPNWIHFTGVGGVGTGSLARALAKSGIKVTGSDKALYDPMKTVLEEAKIEMTTGFGRKIAKELDPDLVVIGNVVTKENPEAQAWIQKGVPFISFPEAVRRFLIGDKHSVVVSGTHGKTTTTSWITFLMEHAGLNPSYLIGGVPFNMEGGSRLTESKVFVGEGDEYDSAFFDKGAKFFHYKPDFLVINSIEFDHADIYRDIDHMRAAFEKLISIVPGDGLCVARLEEPIVMDVVQDALCPVQTFGLDENAMWHIKDCEETIDGYHFGVVYKGRDLGRFQSPLFGQFNLMNLLSGIVCGVNLGVPIETIREAVSLFRGVKRRQEIKLTEPITLVDDFAHHPTEVNHTLSAVRQRFQGRKIWAFFEPRSATARRNTHQHEYAKAFDSADEVLISDPFHTSQLSEGEKMNSARVVQALQSSGKPARAMKNGDEICEYFLGAYKKDDVVVVMSNGEFDKITEKLVNALR